MAFYGRNTKMFEEISFNEMTADMHKSPGNNVSRKKKKIKPEERTIPNRYKINQVIH